MIKYPHFALSNLYLINGYKEEETEHGIEREYDLEAELEHCVRRLLLRSPERFRGWDLRFMRRGLGLSQAEFGEMVDRDAQSVARWEKGAEPLPKFVDLAIRAKFASVFEPEIKVPELLSFVDGIAPKLPEKIILRFTGSAWAFDFAPHARYVSRPISGHATVEYVTGTELSVMVYSVRRVVQTSTQVEEAAKIELDAEAFASSHTGHQLARFTSKGSIHAVPAYVQ